jgi:Tfp pilus assembly protein PilN
VRRTPVILELTPTRLTCARLAGGAVREMQSVTLDQSRWTQSWEHELRPLDAALVGLFESMGITRPRVTLLYTAPQIAMDVVGAPGRPASAREAARLAIAEAASFDLLANPACVADLGRDASGDPPLAHAIGVADRAESPAALIDWLERNGAIAQQVFPGEAAAIAHVATRAFANTTSVPEASVRIGEHATSLAVGVEGRLRLVRTIEVGIATITEPLSRLFAAGEQDEHPRRAALRFLFERGVPDARDVIDAARGLHGADVLPAIQPVLQRLFVEIKQSLRFGLSREEHQAVGLRIIGPGAHVPRLSDLLAEHTERFVVPEAGALRTPAAQAPEDACSVFADIAPPFPALNLLPQTRLEAAAVRATRRALIGGGVAAAIFMGAEAALHLQAATSAERQHRALKPSLRQAEHLETTRERLEKHRAALQTTESQIDERLARRAPWAPWMLDSARRAPEGIHLTHLHADTRGGDIVATLRGQSLDTDGRNASAAISAYARALEESPFVKGVTLGATQRVRTPSGDARQFEITVTLVGLPRSLEEGP